MSDKFTLLTLDALQWAELRPLIRAAQEAGGVVVLSVAESPWPDYSCRLQAFVVGAKARKTIQGALNREATP
jgi:hypothetical protein